MTCKDCIHYKVCLKWYGVLAETVPCDPWHDKVCTDEFLPKMKGGAE